MSTGDEGIQWVEISQERAMRAVVELPIMDIDLEDKPDLEAAVITFMFPAALLLECQLGAEGKRFRLGVLPENEIYPVPENAGEGLRR